ncbi:MAG TPA: hypothetical protein VGI10_10335 [Polyangiaceae bacterium]|jgi:predicted amidophosphoribosyltransferase
MALVACPDCDREISTEAYMCPGCGRPTGKQRKMAKGWLLRAVGMWFVLVIFFLVIWQFMSPGK